MAKTWALSKPKKITPSVTKSRNNYPSRASVGGGYVTKKTKPSVTKKTPSKNPWARFIHQTQFGMSKRSEAEYNRLANTHDGWNNLSDVDRVQLARKPQMDEQLPHAFISNKTNNNPEKQSIKKPESPIALREREEGIYSKLPAWQKKRDAGQRGYGYGRRGTLLTGPRGISDDALTIGRSLLGGY